MVEASKPQYDMIELKIQDLDPKKPDTFYDIEVEPTATVEDLKCNISIVTGLDISQMELYFNHDLLKNDSATLASIGIQCFDMINMKIT